MSFTVTATESGASANQGVYLQVQVLTGAIETGGATSGGTATTNVASQGSLTPNFSHSLPLFSISADALTGALPAAASNNTYYTNAVDSTDNWAYAFGYYSGTVTAATPLTYGCGSAAGSDHGNWCAYEIQPSGGSTPAVDGSSPAAVGSPTVQAISTAAFTPPAGSVLVAMVVAGGTGSGAGITMTITDTSGLGLVWTQRAVSSASDNFQPTWVFTAPTSAAATSGPLLGLQALVQAPVTAVSVSGWRNAAHSR